MIENKISISELKLEKIKDISNYGGGGPMSSHHRVSNRLFDDNLQQKRKSVTRKVNYKLFGGNKFHSSIANWNPQNDLLRSSITATSLNG